MGTFRRHALRAIDEITTRGKLPILVGGTHYYTQSLLFRDTLADTDAGNPELNDESNITLEDVEEKWPILKEPAAVMLEELKKVDPIMADRWHPNDRQKIQRSLMIYLQKGRKASDIYAEQRRAKETDSSGIDGLEAEPATRFPTLMFWTHAAADALSARLNHRVETMLEQGLMDEVDQLDRYAAAELGASRPIDETRGIWISIGYKEFKDFIKVQHDRDTSEATLSRLKVEAVEKTKIATRQYAKRQVRWIRIKLVNALAEAGAGDKLYLLDGSDISSFSTDVVEPAMTLTDQFLHGLQMPDPLTLSAAAAEQLTPKQDYDLAATPERWFRRHCDLCNVTCVTEPQWEQHSKSKTHRRRTSKQRQAGRPAINGAEDAPWRKYPGEYPFLPSDW